MNQNTKENIEAVRKAIKVAFPAMPDRFKYMDLVRKVCEVMGTGYVSEGNVLRRLREFYSGSYWYDYDTSEYVKGQKQAA